MPYFGGKNASGVAQAIINQQPPHRIYIEPFAGHAAVLRCKRPACENVAVELDIDAAAWLSVHAPPGCTVICGDGLSYLRWKKFERETLIYCDPPYPLSARRDPRPRYRCELTDEDHMRLLDTLRQLTCMVQISSYSSDLYDTALKGWRHISFQAATRRGMATEHLWMNYPAPRALHTYTHLGVDYRQRERIKRKTTRWVKRLEGLPELERLALYSALSESLSTPGDLPAGAP